MRRFLLSVFGLALLGGVAGAAPLHVVAAENFYGDLAAQIGGAHVVVSSILSNPDTDPHLFEASASTARFLADADIVLLNGAGYDPWMDQLLSAGTVAGRAVISAAAVVEAKPGDNPHLWYDPKTFPAVAAALEAELERRDPSNGADYRSNLAAFNASFAEALKGIDEIRASHAGTAVTATEPVFDYMAAAMGLTVLNEPFQLAMMNETEPGPGMVADFEDSLTSGAAKVMFYNGQVTHDTSSRLLDVARAAHLPVVAVTETMPADETIQSWLRDEIEATRQALDGKS